MINGDPSIYDSDNWCALDCETTGHYRDPTEDLVCLVGVEGNGKTWHYYGGSLLPEWVVAKIMSYDFVVAHFAKFEAGWLQRCGIDTRKLTFWCTFTAEWLLRAGLPAEKGALSLDGCMARRSGSAKDAWGTLCVHKLNIKSNELPRRVLLEYCLQDTTMCKELFIMQKQELLRASKSSLEASIKAKEKALTLCGNLYQGTLIALQYQRSMLAPVLADIETKGLQLDRELTSVRYNEALAKKEELAQKLYTLTSGVNLGSNKQLAVYLYDTLGFECRTMTAGGSRSTSIGVLEDLEAKTEEQKQFKSLYFDYNDADQVLSKYLTLFKAIVDENDGLMFGSLNQGSTVTHRLSSSGVPFKSGVFKHDKSCQFQNIPRALKELFVARKKGWSLAEADGSSLEFRVAAGLANEPVALHEINTLVDVHSVTASVMKTSRQDAKRMTFLPLFGGSGTNKAERTYAKFFREKYKVIHKMQQGWCHSVVADPDHKLYTDYGMVYQFPNAKLQADGYIAGSTNIFNYPVQGCATAEIIPIALAHLWHNLPEGVEIVNTVHDSIVCEVAPGQEEAWRSACIQSMTTAVYEFLERVYGYKLNVPLGIGAKCGTRWGDKQAQERTYQLEGSVLYEISKVGHEKQKIQVRL